MTQTTTARDYAHEMRRIIDTATSQPGYIPGVIAGQIVDKLKADDPELLDGWLHAQAETFIREAIGARDRSIRGRRLRFGSAGVFADAARRHEGGDDDALGSYLSMPFALADGSHRPLGSLTNHDLLYVRDSYQRRVNENAFYVTVMGALAKRVKTGTVADYYSDETLATMFASIRD